MANSKYLPILLLCSLSLIVGIQAYGQPKHAKTWYEAPDEGWSWYIDRPRAQKQIDKEQKNTQKSNPNNEVGSERGGSQSQYVHTQQMDRLRKDLEELQAKAILNPTLENVMEFQKAYNGIVNRSSRFEKSWMVSSLIAGDNYRESDRPSPKHRKIYQEKTENELEEGIIALARTHGLFFIFKNDCPYCHEMAPFVKELAEQYHFAVKAISPDGQPIEAFPDAVKDNGAIGQVNPEGIFPTLFLVNPHSGQTIPLARGLTSPSELKENFRVIIQFLKEQPHAQ